MQTFMPYSDPVEVARVLDTKRLGAQRREADQILRALATGGAWSRHPATLAWRGHEAALRWYRDCMLAEWLGRSYRMPTGVEMYSAPEMVMPPWAQSETIQHVHRANLARKDPDRYHTLWPDIMPLDGYLWPAADGAQSRLDVRVQALTAKDRAAARALFRSAETLTPQVVGEVVSIRSGLSIRTYFQRVPDVETVREVDCAVRALALGFPSAATRLEKRLRDESFAVAF